MAFDDAERATILAALRCYQQRLEMNGGEPPHDLYPIATNEGAVEPLSVADIDALCIDINDLCDGPRSST